MAETEVIIDTGEWTAKVREHLAKSLASGTLEIPPLPEVANQVLSLSQSADTDAKKLAELIHRDQALASNVLRISNSPLYAGREPIVSLQQAISRIGFAALCDMAFAVSVRSRMVTVKPFEAEARDLWRHSFASGLFAKEIARARRRNVEGAFICGLLHDMGKSVIFGAAAAVAKSVVMPSREAVLPVIDEMHAGVGAQFATKWNLSKQVAEAIEFHHAWEQAPTYQELAAMTALADELSDRMLLGGSLDVEDLRNLAVVQALNLYPDDVAALVATSQRVLSSMDAVS